MRVLQLRAISQTKPDLKRGRDCEACFEKAGTHSTEPCLDLVALWQVNIYQISDHIKLFQPASRGSPNLKIHRVLIRG